MIGEELVAFCRSPTGNALLQEVAALLEIEGGDLARSILVLKKSRSEDPNLLARLATLCFARRKAQASVSWAPNGFFTLEALEQSSAPDVAAHHAQSFSGLSRVLEIGGGVGMDTIALARVVDHLTVLEPDRERAAFLKANLDLLEMGNVVVHTLPIEQFCAEVSLANFDAVWADPARREGGVRIHDPARYKPSLPWLLSQPLPPVVGVKIGPGVKIAPQEYREFSKEWIGVYDECREQILWRGRDMPPIRVTLVDRNQSFTPANDGAQCEVVALDEFPVGYVWEPHGAIIAASCVAPLFAQCGVRRIDPRIAYGVSEHPVDPSCWIRGFKVLTHFPYARRRLDEAVKAHNFGPQSVIKKRGLASSAEELHAKIAWVEASDTVGLVVMTRVQDDHHVFLCEWQVGVVIP